MKKYKLLVGYTEKEISDAVNQWAYIGWVLVGPIIENSTAGTRYIATMEKDLDENK